jgi:hypothetical protein
MMGVEVAKEEGIISWKVQERGKMRTMTRRAGRNKRKIKIVDVKVRTSERDTNPQEFE